MTAKKKPEQSNAPRDATVVSQPVEAVVEAWWYAEPRGPLVVVRIHDKKGRYLGSAQLQLKKGMAP